MSSASLCQASLKSKKTNFTTTTTTTSSSCTRTIFNKLSSTSSTSSISSVMSHAMMTPNLQQTINPFDETNKFRLEQSVLSPNLFQIASTSTPERENNGSLWNIDQRAVLYPADIPTDESSLIAQYMYDNRMSKQVSAAVEAFWSQNKIIIESPLANSNATQLRNRMGTLSSSSAKKHPKHATSSVSSLSSLARNNSVNKLYEKQKKDQSCQTVLCLPINIDLNDIAGLREFMVQDEDNSIQNKLNNSIRKKLFDQNSDDLSTSTTTTTKNADDSFMSPRLRQLQKNFKNCDENKKVLDLIVTKPSDVSISDDWEDSFEFEDRPDKTHRSSSPKKNKKVMCDMGSDNDSVFIAETKQGLDLSPVDKTPKNLEDKMDMSILSNSLFKHHERVYHHFDDCEQKNDDLNSPNLSPISQKKSTDLNSSLSENGDCQNQKSIIFMDYSDKSDKPRQNKSFVIEEDDVMPCHYKREEFYRNLYHDTNVNETYETIHKKNEHLRDRTVLGQSNSTTTTINQSSSQDTGYQTNCFGQNGTNNSSNVTSASEMMMMFKKPNSLVLSGKSQNVHQSGVDGAKQEMTSTPMSPEQSQDDKFNFENQSKIIKNVSKSCEKHKHKQCSNKKFSISLNSFDSMLPVECSTPEKLKNSSTNFDYKQASKPDIHNRTSPASLRVKECKKKDLYKSKTTNNFRTLSSQKTNKIDENYYVYKIYDCSSRNNLDCSEDEEEEDGEKNTHNEIYLKNKILKPKNSLNENELAKKKFEIDYSFMEESIMGKKFRSPSEYAQTVIDKAKQDLQQASNMYSNVKATNRTNRN